MLPWWLGVVGLSIGALIAFLAIRAGRSPSR